MTGQSANEQGPDSFRPSAPQYVRDDQQILVTKQNFYSYHPPLYYLLLSMVEQPLQPLGLLWRLSAGRMLSVLLGCCTVWLAFSTGQTIWRSRDSKLPLTLAALVSFHPMTAFTFATINNITLDIVLFSAFLLISLRTIYFDLTVPRGLLLGLIIASGLLTRINFIVAIPLLLMLIAFCLFGVGNASKNGKLRGDFVKSVVLVLGLPLALSFWWYITPLSSGGDSLAHLFPGKVNPPPFNLVHYICHYNWCHVYSRVIASYWGSFGWINAHLPVPVIVVLTGLSILTVLVGLSASLHYCFNQRIGSRANFALLFSGISELNARLVLHLS